METHGDEAYLTIYEQRKSGYHSPINMLEFDLHKERFEADAELDRISDLQAADDVTVGAIIPELERAQTRSKIAREIGRELATRTAVATMFDGLQ